MIRKIPVATPFMGGKELEYVEECIRTTWVSSAGHFITDFEKEFAKKTKTKYAVTVANGTAALHVALLALDIGPGDEVILPALTFVSTANAVAFTGATVVFADVDPHSWAIDPNDITKKITKKTKAIIPVHLYGYPADLRTINKIAKKHNLYVVEDAAEAHGATVDGKPVGSIGTVGCFSFYGNKIITTGEGGMITCNSKKLRDKMMLIKSHGTSPKKRYWHPIIGYNYRMTNLQAALGLAQLHQLNAFLKKRNEIAKKYRNLIKNIKGITPMPLSTQTTKGVCWIFSALISEDFGISRDRLMKKLSEKGIETRPFFIPLHLLPMYNKKERFPVSERISAQGINLPTSVELTDSDIEYVVSSIKESQPKKYKNSASK